MTEQPQQTDTFEDVESCFRPVAQQYGREVFEFVFAAGMAQQAAEALAAQAQKHVSRSIAAAATQLVLSFNQLANNYSGMKGWSPELLAQVDRDIMLAWKNKLVVPEGGKLILNS